MTTFISPAELAEVLAAGRPVRILDVRWSVTEPDGRDAYSIGHIPGAVYVDLEEELSDRSRRGRGRHPLPSGNALEAALRRWGVNDGELVVAYDDWNRAGSARAWWVLRAAGVSEVTILDGGWSGWTAAGLPVSIEDSPPKPGTVEVLYRDLEAGAMPVASVGDAALYAKSSALVDARAPERYSGEVEPLDPVAGHIPGATNLPFTTLLDAEGRLRDIDDTRQALASVGSPKAVYCGSGVTAAVVIAAAESAGASLRLFPESWSQWSADPSNPVEAETPHTP